MNFTDILLLIVYGLICTGYSIVEVSIYTAERKKHIDRLTISDYFAAAAIFIISFILCPLFIGLYLNK